MFVAAKYNDFEQALIADCRVRMVERPCQWNGCDALMNSGENLYLHLKLHVQEASSQVSRHSMVRSGNSPIIQGAFYMPLAVMSSEIQVGSSFGETPTGTFVLPSTMSSCKYVRSDSLTIFN